MPLQRDAGIELPEGFVDPVGAAKDCRFARNDLRAHLLLGGNQGGGDITAAQVFGERGSNLPRDEVVR